MRIDEIESLVDLVVRSGVSEVTLKTEGRRLTVRHSPRPAAPLALAHAAPPTAVPMVLPDVEEGNDETRQWIVAPMVGFFHHAEPPVSPGVRVEAGQVVGAIESMKLMNDVRAEAAGLIVESLAEAGMAVEYGQPLFGVAVEEEEE